MKTQPPDTSDTPDVFQSEPMESIPTTLQFSSNVNFITQVYSFDNNASLSYIPFVYYHSVVGISVKRRSQ